MKVEVEATVPKEDLQGLTPMEAKRRAAELTGAPPIPLTGDEIAVSTAKARLKRLNNRSDRPRFTPLEVSDETIYIKALDLEETGIMALWMGRNARGILQSGQSGADVTYIAILMACVYNEADNEDPAFTSVEDFTRESDNEDERGYLHSHKAMEFLSGVMDKIIEVNPNILATLKKT